MRQNFGLTVAVSVVGGVALGLLNAAAIAFYTLWMIADDWAVNRSEATGAFDPTQLPPHSSLAWLAAHATMVALVLVDAIAVAAIIIAIRRSRGAGQGSGGSMTAGHESADEHVPRAEPG